MDNRVIKFRVWCVKSKKFIEEPTRYERLAIGCNGGVYSGKYDDIVDGYLVQQYTGLKDKNGKEIYEGDIVKAFTCNDDTEFYAPVVFCPHKGYYLDSEIERHDRWLYDGGVGVGPACEVIGNIFENPELLK